LSPPLAYGNMPWWEVPIMGPPLNIGVGTIVARLSALEAEAIRAVYDAGLRPGSNRSDFAARGLLN
jgi:hypothetical protein